MVVLCYLHCSRKSYCYHNHLHVLIYILPDYFRLYMGLAVIGRFVADQYRSNHYLLVSQREKIQANYSQRDERWSEEGSRVITELF